MLGRSRLIVGGLRSHQRLLAIEPKTAFSFVPTELIVVTEATEISAAIRPYSMAVAPSSFFKSEISLPNMGYSKVRIPRN